MTNTQDRRDLRNLVGGDTINDVFGNVSSHGGQRVEHNAWNQVSNVGSRSVGRDMFRRISDIGGEPVQRDMYGQAVPPGYNR